jgi:hypothetical protein
MKVEHGGEHGHTLLGKRIRTVAHRHSHARLIDLSRLLDLVTPLRFSDLIGKLLNFPQVGGGRAVWVVPELLP